MSAPASTNTIGYLDLPSGVSGDMLLGCLVDAGWPVDDLIATVRALHLPAENWTITAERVMRGPLAATLVLAQLAANFVKGDVGIAGSGRANKQIHIGKLLNRVPLEEINLISPGRF